MMLNRKVSDYLLYLVIAVIIAVTFFVRTLTIGSIDDKIENLERDNLILQTQISTIEEIIEDNNDAKIDDLYELYIQVPQTLSISELTYFITAQLELVGISEFGDFQRSIVVNQDIDLASDSDFGLLQEKFKAVQVQVFFTTTDELVIEDFIDRIFDANQIFIIQSISYAPNSEDNFIGVNFEFLTFYEKEDAS